MKKDRKIKSAGMSDRDKNLLRPLIGNSFSRTSHIGLVSPTNSREQRTKPLK